MSRDRESWRSTGESGPRGPNPPTADEAGADESPLRAKLAVGRRELRSLRTEKTILLALAIQLFIAAFSSFLVVGLVSLYDPGAVDGYETEVAITGDDTGQLLRVADQQDGLEPTHYTDRSAAYSAFDGGRAAAVLDANRDDDGRLHVRVLAPEEGIETTLVVVQLRETLERAEHVERQRNADRLAEPPLDLPREVGASPYVAFTYTVLLPLLLFLPVFISGSIVVDSLIEERQRGTLTLLRVAPLSLADIVDAKLLTVAALAPIQAIAWLVLLAVNGTAIAGPVALVVLVGALSLLVVGLGTIVALYAPDRRQAQLLYSGGIVGGLVVASLLPEHPANTIAKFAIGAATTMSWLLLGLYGLLGIAAFLAVRKSVALVDPESL
ncbi:ABC transporter permease [Halosolutus amylolyticus]|uniref:ABC transporter permease n=1 Tax=Halosolutus amylolyticus TaxID=2932267 RepID=A0ABD5PSQ9_9EURY|nr:ABC transporter permease [Halosolutus amylolyticus]